MLVGPSDKTNFRKKKKKEKREQKCNCLPISSTIIITFKLLTWVESDEHQINFYSQQSLHP